MKKKPELEPKSIMELMLQNKYGCKIWVKYNHRRMYLPKHWIAHFSNKTDKPLTELEIMETVKSVKIYYDANEGHMMIHFQAIMAESTKNKYYKAYNAFVQEALDLCKEAFAKAKIKKTSNCIN